MVNIFKIRLLILTEFTNVTDRQPARGVYRYIYPKISNRFVHVWDINTCFEIAMTSQNVYLPPPQKKNQIPGYATDGWTPYDGIGRTCIASRGKNIVTNPDDQKHISLAIAGAR